MFTTYTVSQEETLGDVIRKLGIKDPAIVLKHPKNRKFAGSLKQKLPKGTVLTVPAAGVKVYVAKYKGKTGVLTEAEYKQVEAAVQQMMYDAYEVLADRLDLAVEQHTSQSLINTKHFIVSWFAEIGTVSEPVAPKKAAQSALKKFKTAVGAHDYKKFEAAKLSCQLAINGYTNHLARWIDGLSGNATGIEKTLAVAKGAGEICASLAAVTIAAPVTLAGAVAVSAISGGGTALAHSLSGEAGRIVSEDKGISTISGSKLFKDTLDGIVTGAASALLVGKVMQKIGGKLIAKALNKQNVFAIASRLANSKVMHKFYLAEAKILAKELNVPVDFVMKSVFSRPEIVAKALSNFLMGSGAALATSFVSAGKIAGAVKAWLSAAKSNLGNVSGFEDLAERAATALKDSAEVGAVIEAHAVKNFGAVLAGLRPQFRKALEKAAANAN